MATAQIESREASFTNPCRSRRICRLWELLALDRNVQTSATFSYSGLSARGGETGDHVDGFGMAFHDGDGCRVFIGTGRACDAPLAEFLRPNPLRARTVIAHVRKATRGALELVNCHPFQREWLGRHWLFCHNGDLKDFRPQRDRIGPPAGRTDSEWAFCWLLQQLRRRFRTPPPWQQMAPVLAELATEIARHGVFNMLLSDGHAPYAHASSHMAWLQRQHRFAPARLVDRDGEIDLASANGAADSMAVNATAPLARDEPWRAFASGETRVFVGGRSVWHHHVAPEVATRQCTTAALASATH